MTELPRETFKNLLYMARRFKLATALNLLGLVVSLVSFYLFMTQVQYQATYNHGIADLERMYRLESDFVYNEWEYSDIVGRPFAEALKSLPEVESYSLLDCINSYQQAFLKPDSTGVARYELTLANDEGLEAFSGIPVHGEIAWSDTSQWGIIIPERIALDYFKTSHAAGKEMTVHDEGKEDYPIPVRGVYKDFATNSDAPTAILLNMGSEDKLSLNAYYRCIIKFKEVPSDWASFEQRYKRALVEYLRQELSASGKEVHASNYEKRVKATNFKFTPYKDTYFSNTSFTQGESNYKVMLYLLGMASLLVIALAAINFLNFTLAESPMRIRGLNARRIVGASRRRIRLGLVGEGVLTAVAAWVLSLVVCSVLPRVGAVTSLTEGDLSLAAHPWLMMLTLVLAIAVGIIASTYPSRYSTSFPLAMTIKGNIGLTPRGLKLRWALVGLQEGITFLMVIYIGILLTQTRYIYNSPYGYEKQDLLVTELPENRLDYSGDNDSLSQALSRMAGIEEVVFSERQLGQTDGHSMVWTDHEDEAFKYTIMHTSINFPRSLNIKMIEGRYFEPGDTAAMIINRAAAERWPWMRLGAVIGSNTSEEERESAVIVGVCENLRYGTTRISAGTPFAMVYQKGYPYLSSVGVRVSAEADRDAVRQQVDSLMRQRYGPEATGAVYFNDQLKDTYKKEFRYMNQMILLSIICIIITLIGIICLTIFETEYRRKEIGIRKVVGATTGEIVAMFGRRYGWLTLVSFAVAAPLAYVSGVSTLTNFAEHTAIKWWIFPAGLAVVGGITLGIVALQSWRTARENPVNSIKSE